MKLNKLLLTALIFLGLIIELFIIGICYQKYQIEYLEKEIKVCQHEATVNQIKLNNQKLKNEKLRTSIESIRLQAFIKAYDNGYYIIETEKMGKD